MQVLVPDYLVDYFQSRLGASDPNLQLVPITVKGEYSDSLDGVEALYKFYPSFQFGPAYGPDVLRGILAAAPNLRWIHSGKAGVEDLLIPELVDSDVILTNGAGAPKVPIAETVLGYILADAKELASHLDSHREGKWQYKSHREVRGMTVAVLGLGNIGMEIARVCHGLGMRVIGTKRRVNPEPLPCVDEVFPADRQNECVAQADYVAVAAAFTPETRQMVNAATFAAMKPDSVLINVGRGALVDGQALLAALRESRIRFAFLDVHDQEPLPEDSPFWKMPNVLVTPHNSPSSQRLTENMAGIFVENFVRYCSGQPLVNVVDKKKGY